MEDTREFVYTVFNNTLKDPRNPDFLYILRSIDVKGIKQLCEYVNFDRKDDIIRIANENQNNTIHFEFVYGCRNSDWSKIYIMSKEANTELITAVLFDQGEDTVRTSYTYADALSEYNQYLRQKWTALTRDDMVQKCGIVINDDTITDAPEEPQSNMTFYYVSFVAVAVAFVLASINLYSLKTPFI